MNSTSWKICVTGRYNDEATAELESGPHQITYDKTQLADCDIAFGQPDPQIVIESNLRWVHLSSAGYTNYDNDAVREGLRKRGAILTNSSSVYDEPCAQHALAMMLAFARRLPQCWQDQTKQVWKSGPHRAASQLLNQQTVLFLGYGAIGRRLEELLAPFGLAGLYALRRREQGDESAAIIYENELSSFLPAADHVVNLLPENDSTRGFMTRERFQQMQPGAHYYNIGRGATTDQEALLEALSSGHLGGAYLDVTSPEPLPPEHALWSAPNCFITPHSAGGHANEDWRLVMHFLENLRRLQSSEKLNDVIFA
jgi:phosphoglycerate dehydrogenase-like enzyme